MAPDPGPEVVDAICDAMNRGDPAEAWNLAHGALEASDGDPVLHFLGGHALLELERAEEAVVQLRRATELQPDDGESRVYLAWALFRSCDFEAALAEIQRVKQTRPPLPELHHVRGICIERTGDLEGADREFARAAKLDPEVYPPFSRFSPEQFQAQLDIARDALHDDFRRHLETVTVLVEDLPADALLAEDEFPPAAEELLGFFVGRPLDLPDSFSPGGELPPRIYLFKRNLERYTPSAEELAEQIRITLYHELGHYLGMTEEELEKSGYA